MIKHYAEHAIVVAVGFLMGTVFALCITPADTLLVLVIGVVFGFSANALFDQDFGGDWFWPFGRPARARKAVR